MIAQPIEPIEPDQHSREHSHDGSELYSVLSEHRINVIVKDGNTEEDDERVEVRNNIVGYTVCGQHN